MRLKVINIYDEKNQNNQILYSSVLKIDDNVNIELDYNNIVNLFRELFKSENIKNLAKKMSCDTSDKTAIGKGTCPFPDRCKLIFTCNKHNCSNDICDGEGNSYKQS
jgi:hypothetical protein